MFALVSASVPVPTFVTAPAPLMMPLMVNVLVLESTVAVAPEATLMLRVTFNVMLLRVSCKVPEPVNWMLL